MIVYIHPRDPKEGFPTSDIEIYKEICIHIKQLTDAVVSIYTSVSRFLTAEQRLAIVPLVEPELASINLGAVIGARGALVKWYIEQARFENRSRNVSYRKQD